VILNYQGGETEKLRESKRSSKITFNEELEQGGGSVGSWYIEGSGGLG